MANVIKLRIWVLYPLHHFSPLKRKGEGGFGYLNIGYWKLFGIWDLFI
jgi:hypothetical protein